MRLARRKPLGTFGAVVIVVMVFTAVFPSVVATHSPTHLPITNLASERLQSPSADHLMGTDDQGRDIFSRVVHGSRVDRLGRRDDRLLKDVHERVPLTPVVRVVGFMENIRGQTNGAVNIKVEVEVLENARWIADVYRGGAPYIATTHADWNFDDPDHSLYLYLHSQGVANSTHINSPELDTMLERQRRELDVERRREILFDIQRLLLDEVPVAYFVAPNNFVGAQPWLGGFKPMVLNNVEFLRRQDEWWLGEEAPGGRFT